MPGRPQAYALRLRPSSPLPAPVSYTARPVQKFLETLLNGVSVGSLYALVALGYTMVYGVLRFINFAHGDIFMLGAWVSLAVARALSWAAPDANPPWYAAIVLLLTSMAICATLGFLVERFAYRPLRKAPRLNVLITAIGVSLFIQNFAQLEWVFGVNTGTMPRVLPDVELFSITCGPPPDPAEPEVYPKVSIYLIDTLILVTSISLMLALQWLVYGTKLGLGMRAVSHDTTTAALMGVPVDRVISITFIIGSALAAAAGFFFALKYPTIQQPAGATWVLLGLKAFVAAVVGGIGNMRGAMVGGVIIGLLEWFGAAYFSPQLRDVYVFVLLIVVLLVKPSGLFGSTVPEKV